MTQPKRPWLLPLLAHLVLVVSLPLWFIVLTFSLLVLAGGEAHRQVGSYLLLGFYWLPPLLLLALVGLIWHALYHRQGQRANWLCGLFIALQLLALILLLSA